MQKISKNFKKFQKILKNFKKFKKKIKISKKSNDETENHKMISPCKSCFDLDTSIGQISSKYCSEI
jgi:hypothetical protein